jgi:hypothetical protein
VTLTSTDTPVAPSLLLPTRVTGVGAPSWLGEYEAVPAARVAVSDLGFSHGPDDRSPGRLLMVDRETILVSALGDGVVPGEDEETGLWGSEVGRGLVVWVRELLLARMARVDFETAADRHSRR